MERQIIGYAEPGDIELHVSALPDSFTEQEADLDFQHTVVDITVVRLVHAASPSTTALKTTQAADSPHLSLVASGPHLLKIYDEFIIGSSNLCVKM
jgi:hypothetical protein